MISKSKKLKTLSHLGKHTSKVTVEIDRSDDDDESTVEMSDASDDRLAASHEDGSNNSEKDSSTAEQRGSISDQEGSISGRLADVEYSNVGWADSMSKILKMGKPKGKKTLVLAKAKKLADVRPKDDKGDLVVVKADRDEVKDEKPDVDTIKTEDSKEFIRKKARKRVRNKNELPNVRFKPKVLDKDRERTLSRIATRGVVQLFNAVRNQQKAIEKELNDAGPLDRKKDKALKKFDKRSFLDSLMGPTKSTVVDQVTKRHKNELKTEDSKPTWNVLRDDFMMGAKMKDWDKNTGEAEMHI